MKIAVFLSDSLAPAAGGNFSYYDKLIRAIDSHQFSEPLQICFAGRINPKGFQLRNPYIKLSSPWFHKLFAFLRKTDITGMVRRRLSINVDLANRTDLGRLKSHHVDLILVPKQFAEAIDNFPFMTINWDAAHKSSYAFPEFIDDYYGRDEWFRVYIQKGLAVIVESEASKEEFHQYYAISKNKIEVVPLFPGGVVDMDISNQMQTGILSKFELADHDYYFYPAQFWAHKNHYNLILAFRRVIEITGRTNLKLILTGSDKGNKDYVKQVIKENNLDDHVRILGFVSNDEMFTLYKNATALVMPTFLGPTNIPVLEAAGLGTPVICSDLSGHRESCGEGAVYVDPVNQEEWAVAMINILDKDFRNALIARANTVKATSEFTLNRAIGRLESVFRKYIRIRRSFQ